MKKVSDDTLNAEWPRMTILSVDDIDFIGGERGKTVACLLNPSDVTVLLVSKGNLS
jgi:hypothetical protein